MAPGCWAPVFLHQSAFHYPKPCIIHVYHRKFSIGLLLHGPPGVFRVTSGIQRLQASLL